MAISKSAQRFVSKKIKMMMHEKPRRKQSQIKAIAYSKSRKAGFKIPFKRK